MEVFSEEEIYELIKELEEKYPELIKTDETGEEDERDSNQ